MKRAESRVCYGFCVWLALSWLQPHAQIRLSLFSETLCMFGVESFFKRRGVAFPLKFWVLVAKQAREGGGGCLSILNQFGSILTHTQDPPPPPPEPAIRFQ